MCTSNRLICGTAACALAATLLAWLAVAALPAWAQEQAPPDAVGNSQADAPDAAAGQATLSDDEAAPPLELDKLDSESQSTLSAIGRRFGNSNPQLTAMSILMDMLGADSSMADMKKSIGEVSSALAKSNCGNDLSAPPLPTGDALWDRYALEVDKRINALTPEEAQRWEQVAALPDEMLAVWEPDFGGDGRYWEMRYACALLGGEGRTYAAGFSVPADYLREAQKRGCASANTLLLLYREMVKEHDKLLEPLTTYQAVEDSLFHPYNPTMLPARPDFSAETLAKAADLHAQCEAEERALLDAAVFIGPDQAWTYYTRALYWFDLGEYDKGTADLEAGNAAPVNVYPRPFPFPQVVAGLSAPAPLGSAAVSGAVLLLGLSLPNVDGIMLKDTIRDCMVAVNVNGDARVLDAWHGFICHVPASASDLRINSLIVQVCEGLVYRYFAEDQFAALDPSQVATLNYVRGATEKLKQLTRHSMSAYDEMSGTMTLALAGGMRGIYVSMYMMCEVDSDFMNHWSIPTFTDLSAVHYPDLALPDSMLKYRPLTEGERFAQVMAHRVGGKVKWALFGASDSSTEGLPAKPVESGSDEAPQAP